MIKSGVRTRRLLLAVLGLFAIGLSLLRAVQPAATSVFRGVSLAGGVAVTPSGIPAVAAFTLDAPRVDPKFLDLFEKMGDDWAYFRPFTIVVSNQSDQSIDLIGFVWTVGGPGGKSTTAYTVWDGYMNAYGAGGSGPVGARAGARAGAPAGARAGAPAGTVNAARGAVGQDAAQSQRGAERGRGRGGPTAPSTMVLNSQAQVMLAPTQCSNVNLCGFPDGSSGAITAGLVNLFQLRAPNKSYVAELRNAADVSVGIDVVVFSDGHVWGPDRSRTIATITARDAALRTLIARSQAVMKTGGDLDSLLSQMAASKATAASDLNAYFLAGQARTVLATNAPRQMLQTLETLPPLPTFVRN